MIKKLQCTLTDEDMQCRNVLNKKMFFILSPHIYIYIYIYIEKKKEKKKENRKKSKKIVTSSNFPLKSWDKDDAISKNSGKDIDSNQLF